MRGLRPSASRSRRCGGDRPGGRGRPWDRSDRLGGTRRPKALPAPRLLYAKCRIACSCNILPRQRAASRPASKLARLRFVIRRGGASVDDIDSRREDQWFRANEKELIEAAQKARAAREAERTAREATEVLAERKAQHFMKCPKCGHDLVEEELEGVRVDRCTFCEGVYLDAGELDRVALKKVEERRSFFRRLVRIW